jgi:hypothetical protein
LASLLGDPEGVHLVDVQFQVEPALAVQRDLALFLVVLEKLYSVLLDLHAAQRNQAFHRQVPAFSLVAIVHQATWPIGLLGHKAGSAGEQEQGE